MFAIYTKPQTGNTIRGRGASSLSDALRSNTTLTELNLESEDKRNNTNDINNVLSYTPNK